MGNKFKHLDLFSGIGGFALAARWIGWETVAFCERDPFAQKVLNKHWPDKKIYDDVNYLTNDILKSDGITGIEIITGGFPCQDISDAGLKAGIEGKRSGLWSEIKRLTSEIRPRFLVVENVSALLHRGMATVLADLSSIGYDAEWEVIPACSFGAPHSRERVFLVAYPASIGRTNRAIRFQDRTTQASRIITEIGSEDRPLFELGAAANTGLHKDKWLYQPEFERMVNGIPYQLDRLRAAGNAIVPQVAFEIFKAIELSN